MVAGSASVAQAFRPRSGVSDENGKPGDAHKENVMFNFLVCLFLYLAPFTSPQTLLTQEQVAAGPRPTAVSDADRWVLDLMAGNREIFETIFREPYDPRVDGLLVVNDEPVVDSLLHYQRGGECGSFYVVGAVYYDYDSLLRTAGLPELVIALAPHKPRIGWASGYLFSEHGMVLTNALTVTVPIAGQEGATITGILPLSFHNGLAGRFGMWGYGCPPRNPGETIPEYACRICGNEPTCSPEPEFAGIWECLRAARCRGDRCRWAECMQYVHEHETCPPWMRNPMEVEFVCSAVEMVEMAVCLPSFLVPSPKK